jgi:hypothetical protein
VSESNMKPFAVIAAILLALPLFAVDADQQQQ